MKRLIPILAAFVLTSCAPKPETPAWALVGLHRYFAEIQAEYDDIQAEVSKDGSWVEDSLPELKYVKRHRAPFSSGIETVELENAEGRRFQVMVLPSLGRSFTSKDSFMLAYLKNPEGKIVHWKSCWFYNRPSGMRLLDVNDDGIKEFCFVSKRFGRPEQVVAAYTVRESKFDPVIAENYLDSLRFSVEFRETVLPNGLLLQPQLKEQYMWETNKIFEIPVRIINQSRDERSLKGCFLGLCEEFSGWVENGAFNVEILKPGDQVDTVVVAMFTGSIPGKLSFKIEKQGQ